VSESNRPISPTSPQLFSERVHEPGPELEPDESWAAPEDGPVEQPAAPAVASPDEGDVPSAPNLSARSHGGRFRRLRGFEIELGPTPVGPDT
jgi:hypothetical protein